MINKKTINSKQAIVSKNKFYIIGLFYLPFLFSCNASLDYNRIPVPEIVIDYEYPLVGERVTMDGRFSDDLKELSFTYFWNNVSKPSGSLVTIEDPTQPIISFIPDKPGSYLFEFVVSQGEKSYAIYRSVQIYYDSVDDLPAEAVFIVYTKTEDVFEGKLDLGSVYWDIIQDDESSKIKFYFTNSKGPFVRYSSDIQPEDMFHFDPPAQEFPGLDGRNEIPRSISLGSYSVDSVKNLELAGEFGFGWRDQEGDHFDGPVRPFVVIKK